MVLMGRRTFAAVEALTGQVIWEVSWRSRSTEYIVDPIVDNNSLLVCTDAPSGCALFEIHANDINEEWAWKQRNMQNRLNSSVLWEGYVYCPNYGNSRLTCMELATGQIMWSETRLGSGSVMMADGKLIMLSDTGRLTIAEASPDAYRVLCSAQILTGKCWTVPILSNGKIYARNAVGTLVCVELQTTDPNVDTAND